MIQPSRPCFIRHCWKDTPLSLDFGPVVGVLVNVEGQPRHPLNNTHVVQVCAKCGVLRMKFERVWWSLLSPDGKEGEK